MAAPAFSIPNQNAARLADPALRQALLKYARRRLPHGEAEDLVQNTLTEALVSSNPPSDDSAFRRWVHGIARHKIADGYRRRARQPELAADVDSKAAEPGATTATTELTQWIESELPKTDGARATLHWLLREGDGESLDDIARDAALPAPRVRQRVSRLRRHFHSRWLALGAAGLSLLLTIGALYRWTSGGAAADPVIVREVITPLDRAFELRQLALEKCEAGAYRECLLGLDRAKDLDPAGDSANAIHDARAAAARALESVEQRAPKISPKAMPKKKAEPQLSKQNGRKQDALPLQDLDGNGFESKPRKPTKKD